MSVKSAGTSKSPKSHKTNEYIEPTKEDNPSPLEFDKFMPWVCLQFDYLVEIVVVKDVLENHILKRKRSISHKQTKKHRTEETDDSYDNLKKISITAYYDHSGHLTEIAILKSPIDINCKVIKAINACIPFHPALFKVSIRNGLTSNILYEIDKMLLHSNITDVCLDDSYVPAGNYYTLLENVSSLKVLSLKRCKINDVICKEIAERIVTGKPGALTVLDLAMNEITDAGVKYLGDVLRRNRSLRHLSLSSNKITDNGFIHIVNHLKEFPLSLEELSGRRMRRLDYFKKKEIVRLQNLSIDDVGSSEVSSYSGTGKSKSATVDLSDFSFKTVKKYEFTDAFDDNNVVIRDGYTYCIGNFTLCSLNVAYNELEFISLKRVLEVFNYQISIRNSAQAGLIRIVLYGNFIPEDCDELADIQFHLQSIILGSQSRRHLKQVRRV